MNYERLNILFNIFLDPVEDEEDIRSSFLERDEDPDEIIERAKNFIHKKEAEVKLKIGKAKQSRAAEFLKDFDTKKEQRSEDDSIMNDLGFAYRKNESSNGDGEKDLKNQAEKLNELKKFMDDEDEHTGKS